MSDRMSADTRLALPPDLTVEAAVEILTEYLSRLGFEHDLYDPDDPWQERNRVTRLIERLSWEVDQDAPVDPLVTDLDERGAIHDNLPAPQPREHQVPCRWCHRLTFAVSAVCDRCS